MPHRNPGSRRFFTGLVLISLVGYAFGALVRERRYARPPRDLHRPEPETPREPERARRSHRRPAQGRRLGASVALTLVFFAGAAFAAGAGDQTVELLEGETDAAEVAALAEPAAEEPAAPPEAPTAPEATETAAEEEPEAAHGAAESSEPAAAAPAAEPAAPAESPAPTTEPAPAEALEPEAEPAPAKPDAASAPSTAPAAEAPAPAARPRTRAASVTRPAPRALPLIAPKPKKPARKAPQPKPELAPPFSNEVVWLNRTLPDPTPPSRRLTRPFARELFAVAKGVGADWALVLGVLRAQGRDGAVPARGEELRSAAEQLAEARRDGKDEWAAALTLTGDTAAADRATALMRLYRAVGIEALVQGLEAAKSRLVARLLADPRVEIYAGGREDLQRDQIDVRVVTLVAYLAESFGQVSVSSLTSGHRLYARPGVISAHVYGHAADISRLGGLAVAGNQQPGSITERAVRAMLLLPAELVPKQLISLLGLGGPSFPLADHDDHIHAGY